VCLSTGRPQPRTQEDGTGFQFESNEMKDTTVRVRRETRGEDILEYGPKMSELFLSVRSLIAQPF